MNKSIIFGAAAIMLLSSCSTITHTVDTASVQTKVYNLTVAELNVKETKAAATEQWKWTPLRSVNPSEVKDNAVAKLLDEHNADVLVEPQYEVKRRGLFRGGSVTVTGYPATYRNFHPMTPAEASMINPQPTVVSPNTMSASVVNQRRNAHKASKSVFGTQSPYADRHKFLTLMGGVSTACEGTQTGGNFGIMFGNTGRRLGWYTKFMLMPTKAEDPDRYDYDEYDCSWGVAITAGAMKPLSERFRLFGGIGLSAQPFGYYSYHGLYDNLDVCFVIPLEVGAQFSFTPSLHGTVNMQYGFNTTRDGDDYAFGRFNLSFGIGYTF